MYLRKQKARQKNYKTESKKIENEKGFFFGQKDN